MNTAEQIQLSYINTTNTGINMIVSWLRFNGSQPIHINEITVNQYNTYYPVIGYFILFFLMFCGYINFNLCASNHNDYKVLPGPGGHAKRYNVNHWKIVKAKRGNCLIFSGTFMFLILFISIASTGFMFPLHKIIDYTAEEYIKLCSIDYFDEIGCVTTLANLKILKTDEYTRLLFNSELNNLISDSQYSYEFGSEKRGWDKKIVFKTMKSLVGTNAEKLSLAVYGDFGFANSQSLEKLIDFQKCGAYDMVLHIGDMAYNLDTDDGRIGDKFMNKIQPFASKVPYMTCPGNHESADNFTQYRLRYNMPGAQSGSGNNLYYSFDVGDIHFVAISSELYYYSDYYNNEILMRQYNWLVNDLAASNKRGAKWKVVFAHRPMYCSIDTNDGNSICTSDTQILRDGTTYSSGYRVAPLEKVLYNYGVDFFFAGHMHSYERLWPTYREQVLRRNYIEPKAPIHIITGSAGCNENLDNYDKGVYPWSAFKSDTYGFGMLDIYNNTFARWRQINAKDGKVLDEIFVGK